MARMRMVMTTMSIYGKVVTKHKRYYSYQADCIPRTTPKTSNLSVKSTINSCSSVWIHYLLASSRLWLCVVIDWGTSRFARTCWRLDLRVIIHCRLSRCHCRTLPGPLFNRTHIYLDIEWNQGKRLYTPSSQLFCWLHNPMLSAIRSNWNNVWERIFIFLYSKG